MSHGRQVLWRRRPAPASLPARNRLRSSAFEDDENKRLRRSSSILRSSTRLTGRTSWRTFSSESPARHPPGTGRSDRGAGRADPRASLATSSVICGLPARRLDSAVAALLVYKAIGEQLTCVFVDHGFLRKGEAEQVVEAFGTHFHVPLVHVGRRGTLPCEACRRQRARGEAQADRYRVHSRLRRRGPESSAT